MSPDEARHRVAQWCIDGMGIADAPGSRELHMAIDPRRYDASQLLPVHEQQRLALGA